MLPEADKKDGTTFPVEISLNYFHTGDQMVVRALITVITERKKIESDFHKLNEELEQRAEERTQLLAGAIPELEDSNKNFGKSRRGNEKGS